MASTGALAETGAIQNHDEGTSKGIRFLTEHTVVWVGNTQLIPLRLSVDGGAISAIEAAVDRPEILEIARNRSVSFLDPDRNRVEVACNRKKFDRRRRKGGK